MAESININIQEFSKQFNKEYMFLYNNDDCVAGYEEAVSAFDEFLKSDSNLIAELSDYRGYLIISDRDAAAFMFALESLSQKKKNKC